MPASIRNLVQISVIASLVIVVDQLLEAFAFDATEPYVACAMRRQARIRHLLTGETIDLELDENLFIGAMALDMQGRWLAVGDTGGRVHLLPIPGE